jgi:hypothetical protein
VQLLTLSPLPYPSLINDAQVERAVERGMRPSSWGGEAAAVPVASAAGPAAALSAVDAHPDPPDLSAALRTLVGECWATDSLRRPRSAADILHRLNEVAPAAAVAAALAAISSGASSPVAAAAAPGTPGAATLAPALASWRPAFLLPGSCPVCADDGPSLPGVRSGCGVAAGGAPHALCLSCALRHIRDELIPGAKAIRCPQCLADRGAGTMTVAAVAEVAAWSRLAGRPDAVGPLRPLSDDELARHAAMVAAEGGKVELPGTAALRGLAAYGHGRDDARGLATSGWRARIRCFGARLARP